MVVQGTYSVEVEVASAVEGLVRALIVNAGTFTSVSWKVRQARCTWSIS